MPAALSPPAASPACMAAISRARKRHLGIRLVGSGHRLQHAGTGQRIARDGKRLPEEMPAPVRAIAARVSGELATAIHHVHLAHLAALIGQR